MIAGKINGDWREGGEIVWVVKEGKGWRVWGGRGPRGGGTGADTLSEVGGAAVRCVHGEKGRGLQEKRVCVCVLGGG